MDCDGPKHALVRDLDGSFVGTYPVEGSVAPFAEVRYDRLNCYSVLIHSLRNLTAM